MFVPDDEGENSDEGTGSVHDIDARTGSNQDDYLPPLLRLERYATAESMYERAVVGRVALETLRAVADTPDDVRAAMDIVNRVATDTEITVRAELMEQLPHIAMICHEERDKLHFVVEEYLLPLVIRYLGDSNNQVRKETQAALLVLMEQGLVEIQDVEQQVCPVIAALIEMDNLVEFHTGAVALMSKMAPLLGAEATQRFFMHRFAALCSDPVFYVRRVCANNFGDFCAVVGTAATEGFLLPYFVELCTDGIWGVRNACAEVFTAVSIHCTLQTRKETLAPVFNNLLLDDSRWVRITAFQALGQFIATFINNGSNPLQLQRCELIHPRDDTRFHENSNGIHVSRTTPGDETASMFCNQSFRFSKGTLPIVHESNHSSISNMPCYICCMQNPRISTVDNINTVSVVNTQFVTETNGALGKTDVEDSSDIHLHSVHNCDKSLVQDNPLECSNSFNVNCEAEIDNTPQNYNAFQYWRVPIPELELSCNLHEEHVVLSRSFSRVSTGYNSIRNHSPEMKPAVRTLTTHEINTRLASCLEKSFLLDGEKVHPENVPKNQVQESSDKDKEKYNTFHNYVGTARFRSSDENVPESNIPGTQDNATNMLSGTSSPSPEKQSTLHEQDLSQSDNLASFQESDSQDESDPLQIPSTSFKDNRYINNGGKKSSVLYDMLYDMGKQSTSSYSQEKPLVNCSQKTSNVPCREQKHSTSWQWPTSYQQHKQCLYNEEEPMTSYHDDESGIPYPQVNHLIHSDVPSNRPIQDIVPHYLVDHFVSMTHPSQAQSTGNEITHHCAFSIPAVALTLGRSNWHLIKPAYEALASDVQWKVRRTVAASIHELAVILGEELAGTDLVPVFHGFIKDLDEVRIGALKHLADFLKLLRPAERSTLLHRLSDFHLMDNECNWRFRNELAEQLLHSLVLFSPADTHEHITPLSIALLMDKVAAVRKKALSLVTQLVHHVSTELTLVRNLLAELAEQFAHNKHWNRRQTFALLCSQLMSKHVLKDEHFASDVFPHLLDLSWDHVPNVRLSVAHTLACDIAVQSYFSSSESPHNEVLIQCLRRLQDDDDKDVRYFASLYSIPASTNNEVSCEGDN